MSVAQDLLLLQGHIKRDPPGYQDEFELQWRHFKACLDLLHLSPDQPSPGLGELVTFVAQVASCYPALTKSFTGDLMATLDQHHMLMEPVLRHTIVKALILIRNRGQLPPTELLPLLFRLFRVQDKSLRQLLFRHITSDIKNANKKGRNERLNRTLQNFMYTVLGDEHEGTAKKGLAVMTEMWRRRVWRDARTVNVIASATSHPSPRILLAALKFFIGQDAGAGAGAGADSDSDDEERGAGGPAAPTKEDVYGAFHKGTTSSKKKKQKKLRRVQAAVKKAGRRAEGTQSEAFAALQLLHDPQGFAEGLLRRLQSGGARFETRLVIMTVLSRAVGVHKLLVLNFYPFLQKYIAPHTLDVTTVLAAFIQACHEQVPPDVLEPAVRQLVDQFVHDRARPEVITVGLKTVREICTRCPLVMTPELLQDLTSYKKTRDKAVSSAARGLIGLFRELAPSMLEKRDRGRGADLAAAPLQFGQTTIADGIDGLDLLRRAEAEGRFNSDGELVSDEDDDDDVQGGTSSSEGEEELEEGEEELEEGEEASSDEEASVSGADEDDDDDEEEMASGSEASGSDAELEMGSGEEAGSGSELDEDSEEEEEAAPPAKTRRTPQTGSLTQMKKRLQATKAAAAAVAAEAAEPWADRILTSEDFEKIRQLQHKRLVDHAMQKHGLKSASKREKAMAAAEDAAEETMALREQLGSMHDSRVAPDDLLGMHKYRKDKMERMATVLKGREGREFGAKASLKKDKTGGLSNREKDKRKNLPMAARSGQARKRMERNKRKSNKNFRGHVRG
ncbi:hypothetical protein ACKKBF_B01005 [Auxenochlorella protothecoides x Auxenochlorella symbiontica]